MNNKGQFSIVAALFVAIILIGTVVVTYSTIRNSQIRDQPQVLSAIDETNFAIKQILGFTVGYYGSVLRVTGNSTYARMLALEYLRSGLVNIASMHPQWGTSYNVNDSDMLTNWFTNSSYSTGNLAVNYNLTGLGIYGIAYETSCKLHVEIASSVTGNTAHLSITKDDDEPVINLGRENFKFYRYEYSDSTWELATPSSEPSAFANGTYVIDVPSGVDPYSYVIQVEDPRGIIVVASSFSHYSCTLEWGTTSTQAKYAVTGTAPATLGAPNGNYATLGKDATCDVTDYQGGTGNIKQVFFNITYYGSVSGSLGWYCQLDSGSWNKIEDLPEGGTAVSPLKRAYDATGLRTSWTWSNLNTTNIRFRNSDDGSPEDANVDAIYVTVHSQSADIYAGLQGATVVIELLQNGTMRWLGQNLQLTTQAKPVPPIPVKTIHVNQTINGLNREVPFQIEDWNNNYQVPAGLTSNASVFGNRQMVVFLANQNTSKVTFWWEGVDTAKQTAYAFTNRYFKNDNPANGTLTNGKLTLVLGNWLTSISGTTSTKADFMRINSKTPTYGSNLAYIIHHGIVRDVIHQEAEWSNGISNCPNVYSQIVITLPANVTYYTYQLHLMFVQSLQSRSIIDLCPIKLTASSGLPQTENGTLSGYPVVSTATGTFYNYSASVWEHHWSQFNSSAKGTGIMFTSSANQQLYRFDALSGSKTGGLKVDATARTIELLPITRFPAQFTSALDVTWYGAVVTYDGSTPIHKVDAGKRTGLWICVEYPPTVSVTTGS